MKKLATFGIVIVFALFSFISCEKELAGPKAGEAKAKDMLRLFPSDVQGVFFIDFHRAMAIEAIDKLIGDQEIYEKYQEFVEKTGIDPKKDIYFIAAAITKEMGKKEQGGAAVINLKYNRETLLPLIKENLEEEEELTEEEYNGFTLYTVKKEDKRDVSFAFIDDSNISGGDTDDIKSIIDVLQKKKENVFKNAALSDLLTKTNKKAMFWGAVTIPPEARSEIAGENPFLKDLEAISSVSLYFDYRNKNIMAEIKVVSTDETSNQQIADFLTGVKSFGAMAAAQKPEIGEILDKIEISTGPGHVAIYASIPEELLTRLKESQEK